MRRSLAAGAGVCAMLAVLALMAGCAGRNAPPPVDPAAVNRVVGDVMSAQARIGTDEKLDALAELEDFLTHTELRTERVAQALTQLADLYLTIELNTWRRRARAAPEGEAVPVDHHRSIALYRKVLADYPERAANHAVYYQLARAYDDLGDLRQESAMLQVLVKRAPAGPFLAEARYRLGEMAFDDGRFHDAAAHYEAVAAAKDVAPRLEVLAAYKRAWSYYLMPDYTEGTRAAVAFVDLNRVPRGGGLALDSQALPEPDWDRVREVVFILARMLQARGGVSALEAVAAGRDYLPMLYARLGEVAAQLGRAEDGIAVYEAYLRAYPEAPDVPEFLGHMVDLYTDARDLPAAVRVRERLVRECGPDSRWWAAQPPSTRLAMAPVVRETAQRLARHYHSIAQEQKKPAAYARAVDAYRAYLGAYPDSHEAPDTWFLLGEVRFEAGDFAGAADAYTHAAYDFAVHRRSAEAAYAAAYARERHVAETRPEDPQYDARLGALVEAFNRLVEKFPREPRLEAAYGRISGLLFERGDEARLYDLAERVIRFGPRSRTLHALAWRNLGESALALERYTQADAALAQALEYAADDPQASAELSKLLAATAIARAAAPDVPPAEAGERLLGAAQRLAPDDPLGRSALVDAGLAFLRAGDEARAVAVLDPFLSGAPDAAQRDRVARALLQMGEDAMGRGDPLAAGAAWDRYLAWFGGQWPERDRAIAQNRARAHLAAGDLQAADRAFTLQLASYAPGQAPEELVDRLAGVRYKRAADLIDAGDAQGLKVLRGIADDLPGSRLAPKALESIVQAAATVGAAPSVPVDAAAALLARYPGSPEAERAHGTYPALLEAAGRPRDAAAALELRAASETDAAAMRDLRRAATLYEDAGAPDEAARTLTALREHLDPGADPWVAVSVDIAHLAEGGARDLPAPADAPALNARVDHRLLALLGPLADADRLGPAGRRLAAEIWLRRADAARERYGAARLVPPLDQALKAKQTALKEALAAYGEAAGFRSRDVTLGATRRMGELLEDFARAMLDAPVPQELTEAQVGIYRAALERRAAPYLSQAVDAHERNLERAREGIGGPDVEASLAALGRLRPEWYDRPEIEVRPIHVP